MTTMKSGAAAVAASPIPRPAGHFRIARVTYQDMPITVGGELSIGDIIDTRIAEVVRAGDLVSEVTVFFETREEQEALAQVYRERT